MVRSEEIATPTNAALSVVVADDDRLTALTLADSLQRHGLKILAVAHNARDAINAVIKFKPDVLVVDLDFGPGPTGLDVAVTVRRTLPLLGIVIVTAYEDPRLLAPDLPKSPEGSLYMVKQQVENPEQVAAAVRLARNTALNPPKKDLYQGGVSLTNSQVELLRLVSMGLSNQAIADTLFLTPDAVKKAITRLAKRLDVDYSTESNLRVELTHRYLQHSGYSHG